MSWISHRKRDGRVEPVIHEQQRRLGVGGHAPFALVDEAGAEIPNGISGPLAFAIGNGTDDERD